MENRKRLEVFFYKNQQNKEPVKEWLRKLTKEDKQSIGVDIKTVQFGWPLGMPLVNSLGSGLWEIRTKLHNKIARLIFFMDGSSMVLVNAFIKKTQKIPRIELELAKKRKREYEDNK